MLYADILNLFCDVSLVGYRNKTDSFLTCNSHLVVDHLGLSTNCSPVAAPPSSSSLPWFVHGRPKPARVQVSLEKRKASGKLGHSNSSHSWNYILKNLLSVCTEAKSRVWTGATWSLLVYWKSLLVGRALPGFDPVSTQDLVSSERHGASEQ